MAANPPRRRRRKIQNDGPNPPRKVAEETLADVAPLVVRDGDSLHVRFPEVTLPLEQKYASAKIGGWSVTRVLREGDDFQAQARTISAALSDAVFEQAVDVLTKVRAEIQQGR